MIEVGKPAPPFSVVDERDTPVTERDLRGRFTVLYFYPRDDTPGCTVEACEFTASIADFEGMDARVFGASPDTPASHAAFIAKHRLQIRLLCDPLHVFLAAYGAWGEKVLYGRKSIGVIRSTVIIDPAGIVVHRWAKVAAKGHAGFVRDKLAELKRASQTPKSGAEKAARTRLTTKKPTKTTTKKSS